MNATPLLPRLTIAIALGTWALRLAALDIPYTNPGTDNAFNPTEVNYVVDLSQASTNQWDALPTTPGQGIYDPDKWAVVFKFSSINIPAGTTVTFKNHPSRAPVVWLVEGDATIAGTVSLNGGPGDTDQNRIRFSEPGPGGFRGGDAPINGTPATSGFGPGGSIGARSGLGHQYPSHATVGPAGGVYPSSPPYGNALLIPLIGGSGNGGYDTHPSYGGGAGGGALLLAVSGALNFTGSITSNGGSGSGGQYGSAGAIRILCGTALGNGIVQTLGNSSGDGRIRIETVDYQAQWSTQPATLSYQHTPPVQLWPAADAPTARIVSVSGVSAPIDPRAGMSPTEPTDLRLPAGSRTNLVTIETAYLPTNAIVTLRVISTPLNSRSPNGDETRLVADFGSTTTDPNRHLWQRTVVLPAGYHAMQVLAKAP